MTFNPHGNKTSDGVLITEGLRVLDYNRRTGVVVRDRDCTPYMCPDADDSGPGERCTVDPDHPGCRRDHWFDVKPDDPQVGEGIFNGERMQSIRS